MLEDIFKDYGNVTNVHLMTQKAIKGCIAAFVDYSSPEECDLAILALDQKYEIRTDISVTTVKNATDAREAAIALVEHIGKTPARHRTSFEKVIFNDRPLWANLRDFSAREPPTVVWGAKGTFAPLYRFLAPRYLSCPDHVLDVERQHAVWQWVLQRRRAMKLKSLNAWLKLGDYVLYHENLPPPKELEPHLQEISTTFRNAYKGHLLGGDVEKSLVEDHMYHARFGLGAAEVELLKGRAADGGALHTLEPSPVRGATT